MWVAHPGRVSCSKKRPHPIVGRLVKEEIRFIVYLFHDATYLFFPLLVFILCLFVYLSVYLSLPTKVSWLLLCKVHGISRFSGSRESQVKLKNSIVRNDTTPKWKKKKKNCCKQNAVNRDTLAQPATGEKPYSCRGRTW